MLPVSVIIPTYNRRAWVVKAVESALAQTASPLEVIVVDDGSTDGSSEVLRQRFGTDIKLITRGCNAGVSAARNTGLSAARGEWVALLDSDDRWLPDKLALQWGALEESPAYLVIHCDEVWMRDGKRVNPMRKHQKRGGWIFQYCLPLCVMSPSAVLLHREVFHKVGYFDETLPACEDYDLWLKVCARWPVLYVDEVLVVKQGGHPDQLSRRYWGMDRFRIAALTRIIEAGVLNADDERLARKTLVNKAEIYMNGAYKRQKNEEVRYYAKLIDCFKRDD